MTDKTLLPVAKSLRDAWLERERGLASQPGQRRSRPNVDESILNACAHYTATAAGLVPGHADQARIAREAQESVEQDQKCGVLGPIGVLILREILQWMAWRIVQHYLAGGQRGFNGELLTTGAAFHGD
jgi:hypothetical protein